MKQPYGSTLPASPTVGDICFRDDGTLHFCFTAGSWTAISGGGSSTVDKEVYDSVPLTIAGGTSDTQSNFIDLVQRQAPDIQTYTHYSNCFWDLYEFNTSGVLINSWTEQSFSSISDLYTFLSTNAVTGGSLYTNNIVGTIYDIVDQDSPRIDKMYGMNTFYSLLKGSKNYKAGCTNVSCNFSDVNWSGFTSWFEDLCNQGMGLPAGYTWNAADNASRVLWFTRNTKKMYGMPYSGFSSVIESNFHSRREWDWGSSSWSNISVPNTYNNSGGKLAIWCSLTKSSYTTSWNFLESPSQFASRFGPEYSTLRLYRLERSDGGRNAILIKPVGIDRVGVNWFDVSSYTLYAAYTKKDRTVTIRQLSGYAGNTPEARINDLIWLDSSEFWNSHWGQRLNIGMTNKIPKVRMFLRNNSTGHISPLSNMGIRLSTNMRDAPFKLEVR